MKVIFLQSAFDQPFTSDGKIHREEQLARALAKGIPADGDEFEAMPPPKEPGDLDCDFVAFVGMKRHEWFDWCRENGQRCLYLDKGYYHREFNDRKQVILWRVSVDSQQPVEYIQHARHNPERWNKLGREMSRWRKTSQNGHIIIANSSEKYHEFFDLPHPTKWVEDVVAQLRERTKREIWYRPKPSWRFKRPVKGTKYCPVEPLSYLFPNCHALVTHGSYISVDALLHGIPGIILGDAVTRSISSTTLTEIEEPRLASDDERLQVLSNLAWCQYRIEEWESGLAWSNVKRLFV